LGIEQPLVVFARKFRVDGQPQRLAIGALPRQRDGELDALAAAGADDTNAPPVDSTRGKPTRGRKRATSAPRSSADRSASASSGGASRAASATPARTRVMPPISPDCSQRYTVPNSARRTGMSR
jgi:hypothetical protein